MNLYSAPPQLKKLCYMRYVCIQIFKRQTKHNWKAFCLVVYENDDRTGIFCIEEFDILAVSKNTLNLVE